MQRERRRARVVEAFMLIQTEVGRAEVVAKQLATLPGVLASEYVTGPYDVVVRISAAVSHAAQLRHRRRHSPGRDREHGWRRLVVKAP